MEYGSEGWEGIGARNLNLAHHVYHDGFGLSYGELDAARTVSAAHGIAQAGISLSYGQAWNADRSITLDGYFAIWRNGALNGFLWGTVDINDDSIARTQTIVLWGSDVHIWLETEILVIKDVTAEYLVSLDAEFSLHLFNHGSCIWNQCIHLLAEVSIVRIILIIRWIVAVVLLALDAIVAIGWSLLLIVLVLVIFSLLTIVGPHSLVACVSCSGCAVELVLLRHFLILIAYTSNLGDVYALLHQFGNNLWIGCATLMFFHHKAHDLIIGHVWTLCEKRPWRQDERQYKYDMFLHYYSFILV